MRTFVLASAISTALLAGCTTVLETSSLWAPADPKAAPSGISYTLAKTVLLINTRVAENDARIIVCVSEEIPVMDDRHQYTMKFRNSPLSADTITVRTYPGSNILREINVTAIDQTADFIVNLAKSAGALAGAYSKEHDPTSDCDKASVPTEPYVDLTSQYFDPGDPDDVRLKLSAVNETLMTYVTRLAHQCTNPQSRFAQLVPSDTCQEYIRVEREFRHSRAPITMTWKRPEIPNVQPPPDCSIGICYRARLTHLVTVDVAGARSDTQAFSLTNTSPLLAMDISRGIAITKTTKITFDPLGQPSSIYLRKGKDDGTNGAEAVEFAKLPATVISGYFGAFNKSVGYVTAALNNQSQLIQTQNQLKAAKQKPVSAKESAGEINTKPGFAMNVSNVSPPSKASQQGSAFTDKATVLPGDPKVPVSPPVLDPGKPSSGGLNYGPSLPPGQKLP